MSFFDRFRSSPRLLVTLGILGGSFLAAMEATIVATAMPTVVDQFGGLAHYSWVFSGYMLTSTVTTPVWGRIADVHGRRRPYLVALGLFLLGSMLCGVATSMTQLIAFRALQGVGAGGMLPLGMVIMGDMFSLTERARAQALFAGVWGISSIAGPLIGAVLTESASWRWIFFMNLPFGLVAAFLVARFLVDRLVDDRGDVDYIGAGVLMSAVTALMLALNQTGVPDASLSPTVVRMLYVAAVALGALFVVLERRTAHPTLPLSLLANRMVATTTASGTLLGIAIFGALAFVPLYVQAALGRTAREAGSVLTPLLLGWVSMSIVTGRLAAAGGVPAVHPRRTHFRVGGLPRPGHRAAGRTDVEAARGPRPDGHRDGDDHAVAAAGGAGDGRPRATRRRHLARAVHPQHRRGDRRRGDGGDGGGVAAVERSDAGRPGAGTASRLRRRGRSCRWWRCARRCWCRGACLSKRKRLG